MSTFNTGHYILWVSHSKINDFMKCPKAYYLHYLYKNPLTGNKITIINPHLALGLSVHDTLDAFASVPSLDRPKFPFEEMLSNIWEEKYSGKKGGFSTKEEEISFKEKGLMMINKVSENLGPLANKSVRLLSPDHLPPRYFLSKEEGIVLSGKVDWIEYFEEDNSLHIIDFKTGKTEEDLSSLQLPIYSLLATNCQTRKVRKASYWHLATDNEPLEVKMPDLVLAKTHIFNIAMKIKKATLARELDCTKGECYVCKPYISIINKDAELVRQNDYQDIYMLR